MKWVISLFFAVVAVTADQQCVVPIMHEKGSKGKPIAPVCTAKMPCCPGFSCNDSKCVADYAGTESSSPADFAMTAHATLLELSTLSSGIFSTLESASQAVALSNHQLNLVSYLTDSETTDGKDLDAEFKEKMEKFYKRLNQTLEDDADKFGDFAEKTRLDFEDFKADVDSVLDHKKKHKHSSKPSDKPSGDSTFDYSGFIPKGKGTTSGGQDNSTSGGFNWQQFVPKGININVNVDKGKKPVNTSRHDEALYDSDLERNVSSEIQDSGPAVGGFDWSIYIPDWSAFMNGTPPKAENSTTTGKKRNLKSKEKKDNKKKGEDKNGADGSFDYSQYIPEQYGKYSGGQGQGGGQKNMNSDLFSSHLESNNMVLLSYFEPTDEDVNETQVKELKKFLLQNTKNVSQKAELVADETAKIAEALAKKLTIAAANLKQAAKELGERVEKRETLSATEHAQKTPPSKNSEMGKYFFLALGIALVGFAIVAFVNGRRTGYSSI